MDRRLFLRRVYRSIDRRGADCRRQQQPACSGGGAAAARGANELFPPERGLLDSFFDEFYEIETATTSCRISAATVPASTPTALCMRAMQLLAAPTCVLCARLGALPGPVAALPMSCIRRPAWRQRRASASACAGWGSTLIRPRRDTRADELGGATDVLCGRHVQLLATPALRDGAGCARLRADRVLAAEALLAPRCRDRLETVCRTAACSNMQGDGQQRDKPQRLSVHLPPGYVAATRSRQAAGGTLADVSTAGELMQSFNSASQGDGTRHWLWFCMDVDECHGLQAPSAPSGTRAEGT